jgi:hypothetical protein
MLKIDTHELERLVRHLKKARRKAIPYAIRNVLNDQAFQTRRRWVSEMQSKLTLRNTWTTRQLRVEKAKGVNVAAMESRVGSLADYMKATEEGEAKTSTIHPTAGAAGQGKATKRTRPTRRKTAYGKVSGVKRSQHPHLGVRTKINIWRARKTKSRIAYLELRGKKGFFRVSGGKRRARLLMLWSTESGLQQPPTPTLEPAFQWVTQPRRLERIYKRSFLKELRRTRVMGY